MDFTMEISDTDIIKKEIIEDIKPVPEDIIKLKEITSKNIKSLMDLDIDSLEERKSVLKSIDDFGLNTIQKSSQKNSLLQVKVGNLSKLGEEGEDVAMGLILLQREMKSLDPTSIDFNKKGFLGLFNPLKSYFEKYQKADSVINDIILSLERGKSTLKNDNVTLEIEELSLRDLTKKLAKEIEMGSLMDDEISSSIEIAQSRNEDQDKIRFISEEVLFPLRQRIMDMQQMLIVNQQGIMAIEVIRRNNNELIRGVDRAKNVTISALRIATIVASALYNQKIVLKKIESLNKTTNDLISGTSRMLKEQGSEIHKQSMEANISVETLKTAFADTMAAIDAISTYKQEALPKMRETIKQFKELTENGEKQIQRLEQKSL